MGLKKKKHHTIYFEIRHIYKFLQVINNVGDLPLNSLTYQSCSTADLKGECEVIWPNIYRVSFTLKAEYVQHYHGLCKQGAPEITAHILRLCWSNVVCSVVIYFSFAKFFCLFVFFCIYHHILIYAFNSSAGATTRFDCSQRSL